MKLGPDYTLPLIAVAVWGFTVTLMLMGTRDQARRFDEHLDELDRRMDRAEARCSDLDKKLAATPTDDALWDKTKVRALVLSMDAGEWQPPTAEELEWATKDAAVFNRLEGEYLEHRKKEYMRTHDGSLQ